MALLALGINFRTAPVHLREKVAFLPDRISDALQQVRRVSTVSEAAILSTCNRTELYCTTELAGSRRLLEWMGDYHTLGVHELEACSYTHWDEKAARHIMSVASGLDSMVLGEPQILGQLKTAYSHALSAQTIGGSLGSLFQHAFAVAKRVRTHTTIGENPLSIASASVTLARNIFGELKDSHAVLVGAGETIELVARHLQDNGIQRMTIANRTLERARALAGKFNADVTSLADLHEKLVSADILIASTGSAVPILGKGAVERAVRARKHRPIFMVDIAVPRDIEPEVAELPDVYLYTIDDLRKVIEENYRSREGAANEARLLVDAGAAEFMGDLRARQAVNTLKSFRSQVEATRDRELAKSLKSLENGGDPHKIICDLARSMSGKWMHEPSVQIRKAASEGRMEVNQWVQELFQLPDFDRDQSEP